MPKTACRVNREISRHGTAEAQISWGWKVRKSTFIDLAGTEGGLLIVYGGTQYFKRLEDGVFANLVLREWQSHFVRGQ